MKSFSYKRVEIHVGSALDVEFQKRIQRLGFDGWELVTVQVHRDTEIWYFKRANAV